MSIEISSKVLLIYLCRRISDMNKITVENICYLIFVFDKCLVFFQWDVVCLPWFLWLKKGTISVPKFVQIFCFEFIKRVCLDHFPCALIPLFLVESIIYICAIMGELFPQLLSVSDGFAPLFCNERHLISYHVEFLYISTKAKASL